MRERIVGTTPTGRVGSRAVRLLLQAGARPAPPHHHPTTLAEWAHRVLRPLVG
ncbi:hypothetical protein LWC35_00945 [Pseudonocardia kujensis]|uniref:hypothetical protein n=1 Tax=Pseudonocardia kujensis TaxID=1128675 RepID=UPI001E3CA68A|nr:hypothetical protein [Pseudonocardia kujensis]MCE0761488.1 hypothetical protein [Pseudonocardia kujensis]